MDYEAMAASLKATVLKMDVWLKTISFMDLEK